MERNIPAKNAYAEEIMLEYRWILLSKNARFMVRTLAK